VNYASNLGLIHGLETMVCMATNGAVAVEGGNWQIFAHMLASSPSTSVHLNATVTSLSKQPDNTYKITSSTGETSTFDSVVLAAPFQFSKLNVEPRPQRIPDRIPYVALHVTLFASPHELDPAAFNLKPEEKVPQFVLTVLPEGEDHGLDPNGQGSPGFFSISVVNRALSPEGLPENIYKIFSAERVTPSFLSRILGQDIQGDDSEGKSSIHTSPNGHISWIHQKLWHSYPYEYPRVTFENIKLDEGLWYTSGIESFISTMETSALMGKNVARLVVDDWMEKRRNEKVGESLRVQKGEGWRYEGAGKEDQKPIRAKL
jgi:prenylcysteine oxidase/farnesylcysteine lyase